MAEPPSDAGFPSTHWSMVDRARGLNTFLRREAIESLVALYWPALRTHLIVRRRLSPDAADDLLQGFAADRILQTQFLCHADPGKGRFRSFLLRCLENYLVDRWRRAADAASLDQVQEQSLPAAASGPSDVFDIAWAWQVLAETLRLVRTECKQQGRMQVWSVFEGRVLRPALCDVPPANYEQLVAECGFQSTEQAANALVTAKRQFRRALEIVVAQYVVDEDEVQDEIGQLRAILANAGRLDLQIPLGTASVSAGRKGDSQQLSVVGCQLSEPVPLSAASGPGGEDAADVHLVTGLEASNPSSLVRLFDADADPNSAWDAGDLQAMLRNLLNSPLEVALPGLKLPLPPGKGRGERRAIAAAVPTTLAVVFSQLQPSLDLLSAVKQWARRAMRGDGSSLPTDLASLLYFAAIAAALVRCGQRISKLDPDLLRQGAQMMLDRPWVGEPLRALFQDVVRKPVSHG